MYTDVNVNISDSQKQKVKKALAAGTVTKAPGSRGN